MKVLVYFDANNLNGFEGVRVRKTIKGALEVSNVSHTGGLLDTFDIAHFISPDDEFKLHYVLERNKPLIVSAFYSENDKNAAYLDYKPKFGGKYTIGLKLKALRFLNNANVVLVPCESCRDQLINYGVTSEIRVLMSGVNFSRFNVTREDEKAIFSRYYRRRKERKMVLGFGDRINNINSFYTFVKTARACPNVDFYYISPNLDQRKLRHRGYMHGFKCPKNCTVINLLSDDMYRSAVMTANAIMFPGINPEGIASITDAMAAKCQIIARKHPIYESLLKHNENSFIGETSEDLIRLTKEFLEEKIETTTEKAYEFISSHTLNKYGEELIRIYNEQISLKNK